MRAPPDDSSTASPVKDEALVFSGILRCAPQRVVVSAGPDLDIRGREARGRGQRNCLRTLKGEALALSRIPPCAPQHVVVSACPGFEIRGRETRERGPRNCLTAGRKLEGGRRTDQGPPQQLLDQVVWVIRACRVSSALGMTCESSKSFAPCEQKLSSLFLRGPQGSGGRRGRSPGWRRELRCPSFRGSPPAG
jgi:hypothetical protein